MKSCAALVVFFCSVYLIGLPAERVALVIGNSDYVEESVFGDIPVAQKDADLITSTLKDLGFEVILAQNASKTAMYNRLVDFEEKIEEGGTALVYFAGHGIEYEKKNFLMGTNAKFQDRDLLGEESLEADTILKKMTRKAPKTAILLLDCCRQPPTNSWLRSLNKTRGASSLGLAELEVGPGLVVGFAASAGNLANDSLGGENGPYASSLTKHMKSGEELMRVMRLAARDVNIASIRMRKENPEVEGLVVQEPAVYGQIYHDFFFSEAKPASVPPVLSKGSKRLKSAAIVVFNSEYKDLFPLNLDEEAEEIEAMFRKSCVRVVSLRNIEKAKLLKALSDESSEFSKEGIERVYIYVSGHGLNIAGRDYFVMNDASSSDVSGLNAASVLATHSEIMENVIEGDTTFKTVMFWDTVRDAGGATSEFHSGNEKLNRVSDDLVTIFSTKVGMVAMAPPFGETVGPFAKGVLAHFEKSVSLLALFGGIKEVVEEETDSNQIPTFVGDSIVDFKL